MFLQNMFRFVFTKKKSKVRLQGKPINKPYKNNTIHIGKTCKTKAGTLAEKTHECFCWFF